MGQIEDIVITYEKFGHYADILVCDIIESGIVIDGLYPIPRGGYPLATHLSHWLGVPIVRDYWGTKSLLIVDDISDSGSTLSQSTAKIRDTNYRGMVMVATLFIKPQTIFVPSYYVKAIDNDIHVIFPWEKAR